MSISSLEVRSRKHRPLMGVPMVATSFIEEDDAPFEPDPKVQVQAWWQALGKSALIAALASLSACIAPAHAEEDHVHQCRRISETGEEGRCCRLVDQHGNCTVTGIQICRARECKVCGAACTPACSGCM